MKKTDQAIDAWLNAGLSDAPVEDLDVISSYLNRRSSFRIFVLEVAFTFAGVLFAAGIALGIARPDLIGTIGSGCYLLLAVILVLLARTSDKANSRDNLRLVKIDRAIASAVHQPRPRWWQRRPQ